MVDISIIFPGCGLEHFLFSPIVGMMIQSDFHMFQGGWNHQLVIHIFIYGYGSIPINTIFSGLFTSINPSYFDVNYRATRFWPIPIYIYILRGFTHQLVQPTRSPLRPLADKGSATKTLPLATRIKDIKGIEMSNLSNVLLLTKVIYYRRVVPSGKLT